MACKIDGCWECPEHSGETIYLESTASGLNSLDQINKCTDEFIAMEQKKWIDNIFQPSPLWGYIHITEPGGKSIITEPGGKSITEKFIYEPLPKKAKKPK